MYAIGLIDDDGEYLESAAQVLEDHAARAQLRVVTSFPPDSPQEISEWCVSENVCALVIDERLSVHSELVGYSGHDAVKLLRLTLPGMPLAICSAYSDDEALSAVAVDIDERLAKDGFTAFIGGMGFDRLARRGREWASRRHTELAQLSKLARAVVMGHANAAERAKLKDLQDRLALTLLTPETIDSSALIADMHKRLGELSALEPQIREAIARHSSSKK